MLGRVEVEPRHVLQFLGKMWVVGNLESPRQVRFEAMCLPNTADSAAAHTHRASQGTLTPVGGVRGPRAQGPIYDQLLDIIAIDRFAPTAWRILLKTSTPGFLKARSPSGSLLSCDSQCCRDLVVDLPPGRPKEDLTTLYQPAWGHSAGSLLTQPRFICTG